VEGYRSRGGTESEGEEGVAAWDAEEEIRENIINRGRKSGVVEK